MKFEDLKDIFEYLANVNIAISVFLGLVLFLIFYPYFYPRLGYVRAIPLLDRVYTYLLSNGFYKPRLGSYNKNLFKFRHDLLGDKAIKYDRSTGFDYLYVVPKLVSLTDKLKERKATVNIKWLIELLENRTSLKQVVFIQGKAGYGKTMLLLYLGHLIQKEETTFKQSIYLSAKELENYVVEHENNLSRDEKFFKYFKKSSIGVLAYIFRERGLKLSTCEINSILKKKFLLLIDGLDEIHSERNYDSIIRIAKKFKEDHNKGSVVLTGRPGSIKLSGSGGIHPDYSFAITSLDKEDINKLIKITFKPIYSQKNYIKEYDDFRTRIISNASLYSFAKVPFLLTLMMRLRLGDKELPEHRDALVGEFVKLAVSRKLVVESSKTIDAMINILSKVSYLKTQGIFSKENIKEIISEESEIFIANVYTPSRIIDHLLMSGLLIHHTNNFNFIHRSIKDYLCARYIYRELSHNSKSIMNNKFIFEHNNLEILFYLCCELNDATPYFRYLTNNEEYRSCIKLLVWRGMGSNLYILDNEVTRFWNILEEKLGVQRVISDQFFLELTSLRFGKRYSSKPVSGAEYSLVAGEALEPNLVNGFVVGLNSEEIETFFEKINDKYPHSDGKYMPVSAYFETDIDPGTVIDTTYGYRVSRPHLGNVSNQVSLLQAQLKKLADSISYNLRTRIGVTSPDRFGNLLYKSLKTAIHPDLFLTGDTSTSDEIRMIEFRELREALFGSDFNFRDKIFREMDFSISSVTGKVYSPAEEKILYEILKNKHNILKSNSLIKLPANKIELALDAISYNVIKSVYMNDSYFVFENEKAKLAVIYAIYKSKSSSISLWGNLRISFKIEKDTDF